VVAPGCKDHLVKIECIRVLRPWQMPLNDKNRLRTSCDPPSQAINELSKNHCTYFLLVSAAMMLLKSTFLGPLPGLLTAPTMFREHKRLDDGGRKIIVVVHEHVGGLTQGLFSCLFLSTELVAVKSTHYVLLY